MRPFVPLTLWLTSILFIVVLAEQSDTSNLPNSDGFGIERRTVQGDASYTSASTNLYDLNPEEANGSTGPRPALGRLRRFRKSFKRADHASLHHGNLLPRSLRELAGGNTQSLPSTNGKVKKKRSKYKCKARAKPLADVSSKDIKDKDTPPKRSGGVSLRHESAPQTIKFSTTPSTPSSSSQTVQGTNSTPSVDTSSAPYVAGLQLSTLLSSADVTAVLGINASLLQSLTDAKDGWGLSSVSWPNPFQRVQYHQGESFFDDWDFFTDSDPTHGQVKFLSKSSAYQKNLIGTINHKTGSRFMRVDAETTLKSGQPRNSVRITGKKTIKKGSLVLLDVQHVPYGPSVWPAFWTVGSGVDWPSGGEIDIVENVHNSPVNQYTLHTKTGCSIAKPFLATSDILQDDCDASVNFNAGCGANDTVPGSFGEPLSKSGGGVYAMLWNDAGIFMWFWPRGKIPKDLQYNKPCGLGWGIPKATFLSSSCNMDEFFTEQTMVFDTTLCGDWAGNTFNRDTGLPGTCSDAVKDPKNFKNAYWEVNSLSVYEPKFNFGS